MKILSQFKTEYFSNLSIQFVGTTIAQLIPFIISPILARLYPEKGFATFTLFMAVAAVLMVPNGGRYFYAMVVPKEDEEALNLGKLSFWLVIGYALVLFLIAVLFYEHLNIFYALNQLWYLVPIYIAFFGFYNIFLYLSVRKKYFKANAIAKIIQTASTALFSVLGSFFGLLFSGLVVGKTIGVLLSIPFFKVKMDLKTDVAKLKEVARKYNDYPKITILPSLLDIFSLQALIFFVGKYYSEVTLGYLGLTNMILVAPLALIGVSFRDVFYQKIAVFFNINAYEKAKKLFYGSAAILFLIGGVIALLLFLFGEPMFSFVYGKNWTTSGTFAVTLGFSFWAKLTASPLSSIFNATNQLKILSIWQIAYFVTTIITLYVSIAYLKFPIEKTLVVYTIHEIVLYSIYFLMQRKVLQKFKLAE